MKSSTSALTRNTNPEALLEQAIAWAVRLGAGDANAHVHAACHEWRTAHPTHEQAWRQVQAVEDEFRQVPRLGDNGGALVRDTLQAANRVRSRGRRHALGLLSLAAASVAAATLLWREAPRLQRAQYATATGERRRIILGDGTELDLNTASEVEVSFSPVRRMIVLHRGELFVRTGTDEEALFGRSFWVHAAHARFEALGTRFSVRQAEGETRLAVTEGRVAIHASDVPSVIAQPGDIYVTGAGAPGPRRVAEPGHEVDAWTDGAIVAKQMRLDAFTAELARYRQAPLHCSADVAALKVSGVFQLDGPDPVGRALAALERTLPVKVKRGADDALTVSRR